MSKFATVKRWRTLTGVPWNDLLPNLKNAWLTEGLQADFEAFLPIASKEAKASKSAEVQAIFKTYSLGVSTNRDSVVYDYDKSVLEERVVDFLAHFNDEVERWIQAKRPAEVDAFLDYSKIKWSEHLKNELCRKKRGDLDDKNLRPAMYRPFDRRWLYYDGLLVDRPGAFDKMLTPASAKENMAICSGGMSSKPFHALMTDCVPDLHLTGDSQCFPLYTYALDGKIRRDNITDWALAQFQAKYGPDVTRRDIFHYVYGLLHSPQYRERYKENLKRELPRIPLVDGLDAYQAFVSVGMELADLHVGYEKAKEYPLKLIPTKGVPRSWRVTKMRLKGTSIEVNDSLTLTGIPAEAFDYKLGNRSALGWVLDQYQVSTDKRSGIVTDPNRADDPEYIVRLVRRVVTVSVETARLVASLPPVVGDEAAV